MQFSFPFFFSVRSRWAAATAMANCAAFVCRLVRQFGSATQIAVGQVRVCAWLCVCLVECPKKQAMKYAHKHMHIVTGRFVQRAIFILFYNPAAVAVPFSHPLLVKYSEAIMQKLQL